MTGDHINTILFDRSLPYLTEAGRICYPIFAAVLTFNLMRPDIDAGRALRRLVIMGVIAQPIHAIAFGSYWPLNILFTLALGVWLASYTGPLWVALAMFFIGGAFVDYQWFGLFFIIATCAALKAKPERWARALALVVVGTASLWFINGNLWALLALPVVAVAIAVRPRVPRLRWAFYAYYPIHFAVLAVVAQLR